MSRDELINILKVSRVPPAEQDFLWLMSLISLRLPRVWCRAGQIPGHTCSRYWVAAAGIVSTCIGGLPVPCMSQCARPRRPRDVAISAFKPLNAKKNSTAHSTRNSMIVNSIGVVYIIIIAIDLFTDSKFDRSCENIFY